MIIARYLSVLLVFAMAAACFASCYSPYRQEVPTAPEDTVIETTGLNGKYKGSSAPIRLWWSSRQTLNPLLDQTLTGKAANDLIFDGLLERNEEGGLQYKLARSLRWIDDGKSLLIELNQDISFHNGKPVSAADAAACLAFVWFENGGPEFNPLNYQQSEAENSDNSENTQEPENTEPTDGKNNDDDNDETGEAMDSDETENNYNAYPQKPAAHEIFGSLNQIEIINDNKFVCHFDQRQQLFVSLLTFPVIPLDSWIQDDPMSLIPGTGKFKMQRTDSENNLWLTLANNTEADGHQADTIVLKQYNRVNEAMQALESDDLDIVLLDSDQYPYYFNRNNLILQRYTSNRSVFLAAASESGFSGQKLIELKRLFNSLNLQSSGIIFPGEINDIPLSVQMLPLENIAKMYEEKLTGLTIETGPTAETAVDQSNETQLEETAALVMIVPDREYLSSLANSLSELAAESGFMLEIKTLDNSEFTQALADKSYDLALCEAVLEDDFNPAWLYGPNGTIEEISWLSGNAIYGYDSARLKLSWYDDIWNLPQHTDKEQKTDKADYHKKYGTLLLDAAVLSPYMHLYLPYSALAYGDRVSGNSKPNIFHPYNGLEELWIWSGQ